jgi:outer membrane receptor protein involved in Fe transport
VEDSWHARSNLTVNLGLRWDVIAPWNEKYGNIQTIVTGTQSVLYPNAPPGLVVPGDPGIPAGLSPTRYNNFAPRIGLAYSPRFESGFLHTLFGDSGKSSIRASYGIFYTAFPGLERGRYVWGSSHSDITTEPFAAALCHALCQCGKRRAEYRSVPVRFPAA